MFTPLLTAWIKSQHPILVENIQGLYFFISDIFSQQCRKNKQVFIYAALCLDKVQKELASLQRLKDDQ